MASFHPSPSPSSFPLQQALLRCLRRASCLLEVSVHDADFAVHELRRTLKTFRALLRLPSKAERKALLELETLARDTHHLLGVSRDAYVLSDTMLRLREKNPDFEGMSEFASSVSRQVLPATAPEPDWHGIVERLRQLEHRVVSHPLHLENLGKALGRSFRRAREARRVAARKYHPEKVHTWRKALGCLLKQLLETGLLDEQRDPARMLPLKKAARRLGRSGDLAMVAQYLEALDTQSSAACDREQLLKWIERRRKRLVDKALDSTSLFFSTRPRHFVRSLALAE